MDTRTSLLTGLAAPMWALEAVMRGATAITHALEESQMFDEICEIIAADERYPLATICWARDNPEHSVDIVAAGGSARQYSQGLKLSWGDNPFGRGPVGAAIRTGEIQILNSALNSPFFQTWSERARGYGFEALISLPLKINGAVEGALSVYSNQVNAFQDAECRVLQVLSESVAFGTLILRERIRSNAMFKNTISALAEALAKRDAYTSGHQKRVTNLAVTIADELGLAKERIRGLHFAGLVHDIGKIQIPSELLTKPSRLTPEEFALMKRHAQAGYEILKDIQFPWPVADIVHQHHEVLDGSGYPRGLKGDDILLEARILTVADIVEAMSSHRPYRPALGVETALAEIEHQRGNKLDADAVDACLTLFRDKDFVLAPY